VVSLLQAIAFEKISSSLTTSSTKTIHGPFYHTLFTDLLDAGDDPGALTHALVAPDEEHCYDNDNIAIRLKTSEGLLAGL